MATTDNLAPTYSLKKYLGWLLWPFKILVSPITGIIKFIQDIQEDMRKGALPDETKLQQSEEQYTEQLFFHYHYFSQEGEKLRQYRERGEGNKPYFTHFDSWLSRLENLYFARCRLLDPAQVLALDKAAKEKIENIAPLKTNVKSNDNLIEREYQKTYSAKSAAYFLLQRIGMKYNVDIDPHKDLVNSQAYDDYKPDHECLKHPTFKINKTKINADLPDQMKQGVHLFTNFWSLTNLVKRLKTIANVAHTIILNTRGMNIIKREQTSLPPPTYDQLYKKTIPSHGLSILNHPLMMGLLSIK